jgi:hypothetical protein
LQWPLFAAPAAWASFGNYIMCSWRTSPFGAPEGMATESIFQRARQWLRNARRRSFHPSAQTAGRLLADKRERGVRQGDALANIQNAEIRDVEIAGYTGPLIGVNNVTGNGIEGAATIEAPRVP